MKEIEEVQINSADGTVIGYKILGKGPALLIIHGMFRSSRHYLQMAKELSDSFTVYIMDRRGRESSGPQGKHYSLQNEFEDAIAIIKKHDIPFVFGHSFGGIVALNIALQIPLQKVAVYEPAISFNNSLPETWLPRFEKELAQNDSVAATLTLIKGLKMGGPLNSIPRFLLIPLFRKLNKKNPDREANGKLLLLISAEFRAARTQNADINSYSLIRIPTLLLSGRKSPLYLTSALDKLGEVIPSAICKHLKGLGHNAPDEESPSRIAAELQEFFSGSKSY